MLTIRDVLGLPVMKGSVVLAGPEGLDREINSVTVMEVPDVTLWLRENDILLTSMYALKDDVEKQRHLIGELARSTCACMFLKLGQYLHTVDPIVLEEANAHDFPIIQIPFKTHYVDIILTVSELIYERRSIDRLVEKYIKYVVFDRCDKHACKVGKRLGIFFEHNCFVLLSIKIEEPNSCLTGSVLKNISRKIAAEIHKRYGIDYHAVISVAGSSSVLFSVHDRRRLEERLGVIVDTVSELAEYHFRNTDYHIGLGSIENGKDAIRQSYFNSFKAIETGKLFNSGKRIFVYRDMEFYAILNDVLKNYTYSLSASVFEKVNNPEITGTLVAYYENSTSLKRTSAALFVHENTIKYRLQRLKELTGLDFRKYEDSLKLYLAVLEHKIKPNKGN